MSKIRKQANYWKRFSLSLPGRIDVAKTFLYSQINYLGCILPFKKHEIRAFSELIENFVLGKLRIAKSRIYQNSLKFHLDLNHKFMDQINFTMYLVS